MDNTIITAFVIVAAVAIVLQLAVLFALYRALRQSSQKVEAIAERLEQQASPVLAAAGEILADVKPKLSEITANLAETSATVRAHVAQIGEATGEITERVRLQAARLDDFILNAAHKVEVTSDLLQEKVLSPMRRVRAIITALNAGLSILKSARASRRNNSGQMEDEEMFI